MANPGSNVGSHATLVNAERAGELMRASSVSPPDLDSGPTGDTRHRISSLQNGIAAMIAESGDSRHPVADTMGGSAHALVRGDRRPRTPKSTRTSSTVWPGVVVDGTLWCEVVSSSGSTG